LAQAIDAATRAAAMVSGSMTGGVDDRTRLQIGIEQQEGLMLRAAQMTVESEAWQLDASGKPVRAGDSVMNLAIAKSVKLATWLQRAQADTSREAELAQLSDAVAGRKQDVAALMAQHAMREEVSAMGPEGAVAFVQRLFKSAMEADPVDEEMLRRLEGGALPYIASLTRLGASRIDFQIQNASGGTSRADASGKVLMGALTIVDGFRKLREGRVSDDLKLCADIITDQIAIWQQLAGSNAIEHMTDDEYRSIYLGGSVTKALAQRAWLTDPAFLLRATLKPALARALRTVPSMRAQQSALDARTLTALGAGRTRQRGAS
jgi:hypothetical protein